MTRLLFGAAEVDITPVIGLPMAGYSLDGNEAVGVDGHLFARAFYLEDGDGERVAFCVADLHSGTRYLHERAAARTGVSCGITVDRLVLCGTHTHTGPGNIYGNSLYDTFAQKRAGFDEELSEWLASRIALAVERAADSKTRAFVGHARRPLWGVARNRSLPAFRANPRANEWGEPGAPGEGCPADLGEARCRIDPRLSVLAGFRDSDGEMLGALAFFGCHATALGGSAEYYHPDWPGHAIRTARWELERNHEAEKAVVAVGLSGAGDANGLRDDLDPPWWQGESLAHAIGARAGGEIARAALEARKAPTEPVIDVRYAEPTTADGASYPDPDARLAARWMIGASGLAGAEDRRTSAFWLGLAREGMTGDTAEPQRPKAQAAGPLQDVIRELVGLEPGSAFPLHAVRVGRACYVTVPGEPTAHAAFDLERTVLSSTGADSVTVIGYAGDYFGYFTTAAEYEVQHYEGGSMIFGRHSTRHLVSRYADLLTSGRSGARQKRPLPFPGPRRRSRFAPPGRVTCTAVDPKPRIERLRSHVHISWEMAWSDLVPFALDWFVRVEARNGSGWSPVESMGRDFDDVHAFIRIERDGTFAPIAGTTRWHARFGLPSAAADPASCRVRVNRRGEFPGFEIPIPPNV